MPDLITEKMKLKDALPELAEEYGEDAEFIRKGITPADLTIKEDERAIISYITTAAVDRDGEIVLPSGGDLKHYRKNPVVLFGHNYRSLPIGKNMWIKPDEKGLIAKTQYAKHDEADKVYEYRKDGFPLAESIGFVPTKAFFKQWKQGKMEWDEGDLRILEQDYDLPAKAVKNARAVYVKWILLEYSDVAVPANQEALELAKSKGLIKEVAKAHDDDCECEACTNARKNLGTTEEEKEADNNFAGVTLLLTDLSESLKELVDRVKGLEVDVAYVTEKQRQKEDDETYTFDFSIKESDDSIEFEIEDEEDVDDDVIKLETDGLTEEFQGTLKDIIKDTLTESNKKTLTDMKEVVSDTIDKLSGKVIQS